MTAGPEPDSEPLGRPRLQLTPANPWRTHRTARTRPGRGGYAPYAATVPLNSCPMITDWCGRMIPE
jgi:hypothetical protein